MAKSTWTNERIKFRDDARVGIESGIGRSSKKEEKKWFFFFVFELRLMGENEGKISDVEIGRYENIVKYKCRI